MSAKSHRSADAAAGLSQQRVVLEAMRLADSEGIDGASMRKLAAALGAGAMSIYHYVASREELLDAMIDVVFTEIDPPPVDRDWQSAMRLRATSARAALARHPWAIGLMESRTTPGPANLRHREAVASCLRNAGFSIVMSAHATWLLDSYVYGFALQEASLPFETVDELSAMADAVYLPQLPQEEFPYLYESAAALGASGYDPASEFAFGLDLVLAALEPLRDSAPRGS
ncbi:MAG: TetR/AcrR family transcriptional regulator C-terminal domain-containing protein [Microcella sp.]|uniref:TetR/AcrR family transcriptional regulator C-terminal domain-containing protein n=1 Tax=Microcella sp. TaxID=1913979 RepID=UPI003315DBB8